MSKTLQSLDKTVEGLNKEADIAIENQENSTNTLKRLHEEVQGIADKIFKAIPKEDPVIEVDSSELASDLPKDSSKNSSPIFVKLPRAKAKQLRGLDKFFYVCDLMSSLSNSDKYECPAEEVLSVTKDVGLTKKTLESWPSRYGKNFKCIYKPANRRGYYGFKSSAKHRP